MKRVLFFFFCLFSLTGNIDAAAIQDKVLICGVCRNIEKAVPNTIQSIDELGAQFLDYTVVIYENNSEDKTKELLQQWAKENPKVIFISEDLTKKELAKELSQGRVNRTEGIARARNKVLDVIMKDKYEDYKYVVWADLDFLTRWDIETLVETILHPEQEWDAVFANGLYDRFAFRDAEFPIGYELLGDKYWERFDEIQNKWKLDSQSPWRKVYSAFGGLGIYKREAIKGCRYSGVITQDLERVVTQWLKEARTKKDVCYLKDYQELVSNSRIIDIVTERLLSRKRLPKHIGVRLHNQHGLGKIVWFSCGGKSTLPWTCEHVPFHATMILKGRDRLYINPRLISIHD